VTDVTSAATGDAVCRTREVAQPAAASPEPVAIIEVMVADNRRLVVRVAGCFERVISDLLADARITGFVPALGERWK
jgi:hypothetical protein